MYNEWSLDVLYKGIDDPALAEGMTRLEELIAAYKAAVGELDAANAAASLRKVIEIREEMMVLIRRLGGYFSLRRSANSADTEGAAYTTKIQNLATSIAREAVVFQKFVGELENIDEIIAGDEVLSAYKFYFHEVQEEVSHTMSDEAEAIFARMDISGGGAWGDMVS